jgi:hypothetical protein
MPEDQYNNKVFFEDKVRKFFLHYYNLKPIMKDHACMQAVFESPQVFLTRSSIAIHG